MSVTLNELMTAAESMARDAGALLLEGRAHAREGLLTKTSVMDMTTTTDAASEKLIVGRIRDQFPYDGIVGEEGSSHEGTSTRRWLIDPIDGTINFVKGWDFSVVSIGVEVDGEFAVGVIFNPFDDEMYTAATGHGAFLNGKQLPVRAESIPVGEALAVVVGAHLPKTRRDRAEVARTLIPIVGDLRITGSAALDFCYAASGRIDAGYGSGYSIWDYAAGTVIAREAGCIVTGLAEDQDPSSEGIVFGVPSVLPEFRALVQQGLDSVTHI